MRLGVIFIVALAIMLRVTQPVMPQMRSEREREKAAAREQFSKNFRNLQVISQELVREHEANRLNPARLAKNTKAIHQAAAELRKLMALGEMVQAPHEVNKDLRSPSQFDRAIRHLAKLIYDFAHNPIHKNSKVFDTREAAKAQKDLLTIISLAKVLESQAKAYGHSSVANEVFNTSPAQSSPR